MIFSTSTGAWVGAQILGLVWRYRSVFIIAALAAAVWWYRSQYLGAAKDVEDFRAAVEKAAEINRQNVAAYDALQAEKAAVEKLLNDRVARKTKEADRLGDLVQHILSQEKTNACAASPGIRAVLDGLRNRSAGSTP